MSEIPAGHRPRLQEWLREAAVKITIIPMDQGNWFGGTQWWVEVHNGLEGDDEHAGTIIARCTTELEAELVAAALWAQAVKP